MTYDFDRVVERTGTDSSKWDGLKTRFGVDAAIPMWVADMDFPSPQPVIDALTRRAEHGVYGYTLRADAYYQAIEGWMQKRHQWNVERDWLMHSPGVVSAIAMIVDSYTQPGDKVVVQPPVYYPFMRVVNNLDRQIVNNPLKYENGTYNMDFEDLADKLDDPDVKLLILCSPHNPVGRVWTREELTHLGNLCLEKGVLVVSDEIHSDLVYKMYTHVPFASISQEFADNSLTCIAPSKTFNLAGLQTSVVIIPNEDLREKYKKTLGRYSLGGANIFGTAALTAAYTHGEEWLDQLLDYLEGNLALVTAYMEHNIPAVKVVQPQGTYLVWLDFHELGLDNEALDQFVLHKAGIALDEGHIFGPGGEGFQRINIACPRSVLVKALDQLALAVKEFSNQ